MVNLFHFEVFRVTVMESGSSINVAEVVLNGQRIAAKRNQGYGNNIGDGQIVPSAGQVIDPDLIDAPALGPEVAPVPPGGLP